MKQPIVCDNCANALREVVEVRRELAEKCQQIDAMKALLKDASDQIRRLIRVVKNPSVDGILQECEFFAPDIIKKINEALK